MIYPLSSNVVVLPFTSSEPFSFGLPSSSLSVSIRKIARRTTGAKDFYLVQGIDAP